MVENEGREAMMSYQALYRKWRPQTFADIVGQEAVSRTLKNAINQDKTSHAYLFNGPRGTGKTSAAKIFAKAINCPNQNDGEPCNQCHLCQAITEGRLADVIEIDAASNNGVEEIRDIRDKVRYAPTEANYKVYIIDEVHMLSTGAFNALLKTLEEPPSRVIFILATTEAHKIPATVISRTQRFDFKRLSNQAIKDRMAYILDQEGVTYEAEALELIAQDANGGMRDALSLLDQVISFSQGEITTAMTRQVTGILSDEQKIAYVEALGQGDTDQALAVLRQILQAGREASRFVEEMLLFTRDLLLAKQSQGAKDTELMKNYDQSFYDLAKNLDRDLIYQMMKEFRSVQEDIRFAIQGDIYLEVATIKLADLPAGDSSPSRAAMQAPSDGESQQLAQLKQEVQALKQAIAQVKGGQGPSPASQAPAKEEAKPASDKRPKKVQGQFKPAYSAIYKTLSQATKTDLNQVSSVWPQVVESLPTVQQALLHQTEPVAASPEAFVLSFDYEIFCQRVFEDKELQETVATHLQNQINHPGRMLVMTSEQWQEARGRYVKAYHEGRKDELIQSQAEKENSDASQADSPTSPVASQESEAPVAQEADQPLPQGESPSAWLSQEDQQAQDPLTQTMADLFGADNDNVTLSND
ncbi:MULTISPECIES: DNA polymerase III subunit gamma/tau [Aerococcus]|uniref:DNA polymerase III subunit gamma/tau n=1 Tax=Aerococcus TaxID=1375 RepID=UPI000DCBC883|nr:MULTISPECIES: DNA polymerase III subunit gamma/tau [Aerococcus]KAA9234225.1 DNA polymerase III subunit gamma/tau [Aerococcus mictus]MDK6292454.1 DNA polymerase III subunit gamma/tau [Aerococcus urinae]MDK6375155.1 DNA polymerase III subunit gamma/tau [Aerococcus urinae]MDK6421525.1 DNA polymerase III subunit gamma/tau [Aerococcus urinae]MDK8075992.1 DNA polymerase III subunit gamma/tau [Aerococcus urinae]